MMSRLQLLAFPIATLLLAGCVLPVPHRRMHSGGVDAKVVDANNNDPITGAKVSSSSGENVLAVTDSHGRFTIPPEFGWHGAYLFGPISYSLLPHFDMPGPRPGFRVDAAGYRPRTVPSFFKIGTDGHPGQSVIRLTPK